MSTAGIIVEYNPFHNGHLYHLEQTKKITGCDNLVAVMSGNFVQRGEPAVVNKWARTRMALDAGVDLVIELPVIYSTSSAEGFAHGSVMLLESLGIIDQLCFGSESGTLDELNSIAAILADEPVMYKKLLKENLKLGISFPSARQKSLTEYMIYNNHQNVNSNIDEIINNSNNILGIEYLKALYKLRSKIKPVPLKRIYNDYSSTALSGSISSATSIRANFENDAVKDALPSMTYEILMNEKALGRCPVTLQSYSDLIMYSIRNSTLEQIRNLPGVDEGLEYKIKKACDDTSDIEGAIEYIKNKRYTRSRIQRIFIYSLLNITKDTLSSLYDTPKYIRVLGFNSKGRSLINEIRSKTSVSMIVNPGRDNIEMLSVDIHATDIYVLGYANSDYKQAKLDLKLPPVQI